jgi:hypothetical protein
MPKHKIVFNERFEIHDQAQHLIKKVALTVRLSPSDKPISPNNQVSESSPHVYEMNFIDGDKTENKVYYAPTINDLKDLFITKLQKAIDLRDPEKTTVKLNRNNRYFKSALVICPHCGTAIQRYYGFTRGLETKCRRCRRVFTSG